MAQQEGEQSIILSNFNSNLFPLKIFPSLFMNERINLLSSSLALFLTLPAPVEPSYIHPGRPLDSLFLSFIPPSYLLPLCSVPVTQSVNHLDCLYTPKDYACDLSVYSTVFTVSHIVLRYNQKQNVDILLHFFDVKINMQLL